jgi:hypothetical protein
MSKAIFNMSVGAVFGFLLALTELNLTTWQYWVLVGLVVAVMISSARD